MLEVSVAAARESMGWTRAESAFLVTAGIILIGLPSALSYSAAGWTFYGVAVLDFMDETVGTIGLPVTAVITSVVFSWYLPQEVFETSIGKKWNAGPVIRPLCRYIIPAVIIVTTGARLISGIDFGATRLVPGTPFIGTVPQIGWICVILLLLFVFIYSACRIRGCRLPGWLRYRRES
jgi:NSS family neurotransmitter:Na+ symporter